VLVAQSNKFGVYPNPAISQFTVQLNNFKATKAEIILVSESGITVQRKTVDLKRSQSIVFSTSRMAAGVYLVKVVSEEGIQTSKVVIQR